MWRRRPEMIYAKVPGRGHLPWLDEAESVAVVRDWVRRVGAPTKPGLYSTNSIET